MAREKGRNCVYHVIQRGNERKSIFLGDDDRERFLDILALAKGKYGFVLYCYCLMENHVHLLLADEGSDISQVMKSINVSYAMYFNRRYRRIGHLFQDRFKSMIITDDVYLVEVSRYIHNNPMRVGIVERPEVYQWSSCGIYSGERLEGLKLLDTSKILRQFSGNPREARRKYLEYVTREPVDVGYRFLAPFDDENSDHLVWDKKEVMEELARFAASRNICLDEILRRRSNKPELRVEAMKMLRKCSVLTLKEIGEIFGGITESAVSRAFR